MKKTLLTLVAATAMIIGLAGCDLITGTTKNKNDNDSGSWKEQKAEKATGDAAGTVVLSYSDKAPTFAVWTDTKGYVLAEQPKATADAEAKTITWKFKDEAFDELMEGSDTAKQSSKNFVLYINTSDATKDARGRVCADKGKKVSISIDKPYEEIAAVGLVTITNNEPTTDGSAFPTGDYTVTEIWPLDPKGTENDKVGGSYEVNGNMVFKDVGLAKEKSITFPVKAGSQIVGVYQPNRSNKYDYADTTTYKNLASADKIKNEKVYDLDGDGTKEATRAEVLDIADDIKDLDPTSDDDAKKILKAYVAANKKLIYGHEFKVDAHKTITTAVNTNAFGTYWFVHNTSGVTRLKAIGDAEEVTVYAGAIEK